MKTTLLNTTLALLVLVLAILTSCNNKSKVKETVITEEMAKVVSAITSGEIDPDQKIKIHFVDEMVSQDKVQNENVIVDGISIHPKVKGQWIWEDRETLVFKAEESFQY